MTREELEAALVAARAQLDAATAQLARIPVLERTVLRHKAVAQELERLVENRTRDLYLAMDTIKRQARLVGTRTAIALLREHGTLLRAAPRMLHAFGEELGWHSVHLWIYESETDSLVCRAEWSEPSLRVDAFHTRTRQMQMPRGVGLPGRVLESGAATWIDLASDSSFPRAQEALEAGLATGCAFPVMVDGAVHAVIEMFSTETRPSDDDLVVTFNALGNQIGEVIEAERTKQQLRANELLIARRIQTEILPRELRVEGLDIFAGMRPADEVGGDYYDVLPFPGGAWLGIGDVTGHGVRAGMIMIMLQSATAALTQGDAVSPKQVVTALNTRLHDVIRRRMRSDDHVTFTLLRYTTDGKVRFAGAHEDLIVWRANTRCCELVCTRGTWLGGAVSIERATVEDSLQLAPGDMLVLYTDGIIEARNAHRQEFGVERLCDLIAKHAADAAPADLYATIIGETLAWGPQDDDITLVVIRKT